MLAEKSLLVAFVMGPAASRVQVIAWGLHEKRRASAQGAAAAVGRDRGCRPGMHA